VVVRVTINTKGGGISGEGNSGTLATLVSWRGPTYYLKKKIPYSGAEKNPGKKTKKRERFGAHRVNKCGGKRPREAQNLILSRVKGAAYQGGKKKTQE